jgi:hypothetical protein
MDGFTQGYSLFIAPDILGPTKGTGLRGEKKKKKKNPATGLVEWLKW